MQNIRPISPLKSLFANPGQPPATNHLHFIHLFIFLVEEQHTNRGRARSNDSRKTDFRIKFITHIKILFFCWLVVGASTRCFCSCCWSPGSMRTINSKIGSQSVALTSHMHRNISTTRRVSGINLFLSGAHLMQELSAI